MTQNRTEQITAAPDAGTDPLQGFTPDPTLVGGGEMLAGAAVATETTVLSEAIRIACDLATGAVSDPTAGAIRTRAAWRHLNAKGNGNETYRRALSPGGQWRFVSGERLPRGTYLAGDRKASIRGDVFMGDLVADYDRALSHGKSRGEAAHDGKIGLVTGPADNGAEIWWMDAIRQKDGTIRVILPTGAHLTIVAPGWR
jgi:hypothetical protein